ncbi:cytochrome P450 [Rhodococcus corynebacterioides]|nr:cytochrome P450 [Rhodococcus corynebacterioides]
MDTTSTSQGRPATYTENLFSPAAIADAHRHYRVLRSLGPVAWSSKHKVFVVSRYREARAVLADDAMFRSDDGIALTALARFAGRHTTLLGDGTEHDRRRKLVASHLTPRALRPTRSTVAAVAESIVERAVARRDIDGVEDIALEMPLTIVPDLVGWPDGAREKLLPWGVAGFDFAGPVNRLYVKSLPGMISMRRYVGGVIRRRDVRPGSAADNLIAALDRGEISRAECASMLIDLLAPSIDTTASVIAAALQLFADHPDQWATLRADRTLMSNAVNEVVRLASPLRVFARRVVADTVIGGVSVPAGARLLVFYAAANRDETVWPDPDRFDITRDAAAHLGFGHGVHSCAGQGLGRLETSCVLDALLDTVDHIERRGPGARASNNIIARWESLPLRLVPLAASAGAPTSLETEVQS